ncbi:MAG: hypothetical protein LBG97_09125, partial [Coriobacteriales bacterium]|nr:hypothetical protein [Coriobacteriales bacterium]
MSPCARYDVRYLDVSSSRFITQDSYLGTTDNPLSLNRYLYAYANPLMHQDPTGKWGIFGAIAQAVSTAASWVNTSIVKP